MPVRRRWYPRAPPQPSPDGGDVNTDDADACPSSRQQRPPSLPQHSATIHHRRRVINSIDASGEVMEYGSSNDQRMQDMEIWPSDGGGVEEYDPWTAWLYKPHTVSVLLAGACLLIWASGVLHPEITSSHDKVIPIKRGVWAMIAVFLAYCTLQAPSTILIRPHPAVWRLVHGMAVVYLVALTFLLFQKRDDARQFMKHLHPGLGVELPERSYGSDCRMYVPENPTNRFINIQETLFDEFVIAHVLGWWGKAVMIRNQLLLWVLSVGFELMELTFRHMLPNFNECWWDSIWAGMHTVRYFDGKTYEWVKRSLCQFTPAKWDKDQWHPFMEPRRFIQVFCLCVGFMTVELNTFFLKFCLWIPPRNPLVKTSEEGGSFLLAFVSYMHGRAAYMHEVWTR
uniref:CDP-diacylglycerol--serine O-phosphatidyltransferase n=1 Tax=Oryza glumipatula TaxID=40148 RepID=A0A0D9YD91_9ORYZ